MRKFGIVVIVLLVVVVAALAIVPRFLDVNRYRGRIEAELSKRLGRQVSVGQMSLSLLPPSVRVQNAIIAEDPSFNTSRPFAQAQNLSVSLQLMPLLRREVAINSIALHRPTVEVVRNAKGVWNFATLGGDKTGAGGDTEFQLGKLEIEDGTLAVTDQQKHQSRAVYDHIDFELNDYAKGKPFAMALTAHLPGEGRQLARLEGKGGPINDASMINTPFNGTINLDQVALSGLQKFLNSEALAGTEATMSGKADVSNSEGKLHSKGSIRLDNARVRGLDIGYPITLDYDVTDDLQTDVIQLGKTTAKLGNTPVSLSGTVNTRSTPALGDLNVQASNVSIGEVSRLAAAFGVAFNPGMQVAGKLNANLQVQGALNNPTLNGTVQGSDLSITGKDVPAPVKVPGIQLALTPQQIRSNDFTANAGGTNVSVRFAMAQYTTSSPVIDAVVRTSNANVGELLAIAQAAGITAADGMTGSGTISLDVTAKGPVKRSEAMQFSGTGSIQNASVKSPQMNAPANVRAANIRFTQNSMMLDGVQASIGSTNATGNMTVRNFQAPNVQFTLNADKLDVLELQKIFNAAPAPTTAAGNLSIVPVAHAQSTAAQPSIITRMTGGGNVSIGNIVYDQLNLQNARTNIALDRGVIRLNPVNALLYGGQANGQVVVDMRGQTPVYNIAMRTQKVDSNRLIASVSSVKEVLYGLLASNIQASFAQVPSGTDIARTLNGRVSLNLAEGRLAKVDILQQLSSVGKFQTLGRAGQDFTRLQQLAGDFEIRNGVASTDNLKALIDGGTLAGTGSVNLVDQSINMRLTAVLSKNYSQMVGGNSVGGFMQTALANNNGELVLPVLVTGTFQNMSFAPDVQAIAQMKMQNLLPSFSNPGQLTTGILGAIGGKGAGKQGGVGGILDALSGKPKENQQYDPNQQPNAAGTNAQPQQQQTQQQQPSTTDTVNSIIGLFGKKKQQDNQQQQPQQQQQQQPAR